MVQGEKRLIDWFYAHNFLICTIEFSGKGEFGSDLSNPALKRQMANFDGCKEDPRCSTP
jgi:hypothetical protein